MKAECQKFKISLSFVAKATTKKTILTFLHFSIEAQPCVLLTLNPLSNKLDKPILFEYLKLRKVFLI